MAGFSAPVAGVLCTALTIVAAVGALWLLGVRDPRCYAIALAAHPVVMGELVGAVSGFVLLGLAAAWRWRDSRATASCAIGITLAAKVFCWPVVLWLLATRRIAAGVFSVSIAFVVVIGTWAAIGFAGLRGYLHLLSYVTSHEAADGYSPAGLLHAAGVPLALGEGVAVVAALLLMATVVGRRGGDAIVFVAASAAALVASPVVWDHYFVLLVIPCALAWPRFSPPWLLLLSGWMLVVTKQDSPSLFGAIACDLLAAAVFAMSVRAMSLEKESRGGEGLQSSPPRFDSDPRRRVER